MMPAVYRLIGRVMVRYWLIRYRRQIRIAAVVGTGVLAAGAYLIATRQPPEG
jgi:hypothetical protein